MMGEDVDLDGGLDGGESSGEGMGAERAMVVRVVDVGGRGIRTATWPGDGRGGPPLLVCNGIGANLEVLGPLARALPGKEVIAFDMPGTGGSAAPALPYRFGRVSRLVIDLLDALGVEGKVDVMGISWGGMLAQALAFEAPERVRRLVLAGTSPGALMVPGRVDVLLRLASPGRYRDLPALRRDAGKIYGGRMGDPAAAAAHAAAIVPPTLRGYLYQLAAIWGWSSLPWLWRIRAPALVMHGRQDPIIPAINAQAMTWLLPKARLVEIDDGHLFMLTSAEETARHLRGFLDEPTL